MVIRPGHTGKQSYGLPLLVLRRRLTDRGPQMLLPGLSATVILRAQVYADGLQETLNRKLSTVPQNDSDDNTRTQALPADNRAIGTAES